MIAENGTELLQLVRDELSLSAVERTIDRSELYVCDVAGRLPLRLNGQLVVAERGAPEGVRVLIEHHLQHTGSAHAADLLDRWDEAASSFWRIVARTELATMPEAAEAASAAV